MRRARSLPHMLERGSGYLLNTASAAGLLTSPGDAPYAVTKHGAVAFAEWLAVTYGDRGIAVSVLCPLGVATPMLMGPLEAGDRGRAAVAASGQIVTPDHVADVVVAGARGGEVPDPAASRGRYVLGAEGVRPGPLARRRPPLDPIDEGEPTCQECRIASRW